MLKKRELSDCRVLFDLMSDPAVFPFVRHKASSFGEFLFITKQIIEQEEQGNLISRTILDECGHPIGTITLYDIENRAGFIGTWIGKMYFGKGYNQAAKEAFLSELFYEHQMETVYMRIRKENVRSRTAAEKLPYCQRLNENPKHSFVHNHANADMYEFYYIQKVRYTMHIEAQAAMSEVI
ncbi:GNAT family N-acetyltransferase [Aneurinibacillus sp. Ricciae_BoGa-3]|uniref:GNAT family N-acetyltransferase n=1 Tax=Aneurinibacillus sp. Ricciae_BoGa-3 TaxID=3022697 RepID=UPI002341A249|nr:GNAT family N-acetyltransferase [Aneurinibacillus sp. Ricciae_BoGa-3]WCK54481.1 GNAT family N-acetyltransferase [Aneurinibacillus sp. Ricciae_BoGa-3]